MKIVTVSVRPVGQSFGCVGIVRDARSGRRLGVTRLYPYGFDGPAHAGAVAIAESKGWRVAGGAS